MMKTTISSTTVSSLLLFITIFIGTFHSARACRWCCGCCCPTNKSQVKTVTPQEPVSEPKSPKARNTVELSQWTDSFFNGLSEELQTSIRSTLSEMEPPKKTTLKATYNHLFRYPFPIFHNFSIIQGEEVLTIVQKLALLSREHLESISQTHEYIISELTKNCELNQDILLTQEGLKQIDTCLLLSKDNDQCKEFENRIMDYFTNNPRSRTQSFIQWLKQMSQQSHSKDVRTFTRAQNEFQKKKLQRWTVSGFYHEEDTNRKNTRDAKIAKNRSSGERVKRTKSRKNVPVQRSAQREIDVNS